ncbi:hypothetical protein SO802_007799 [Lithocarpus litseifolius]|uniref:Myb/SANT-like domain-containing protein n=1 Tax=Lithocarpus litseifolius TaxID=425828 RepID=A0AAW2DUQ0_9ROSI
MSHINPLLRLIKLSPTAPNPRRDPTLTETLKMENATTDAEDGKLWPFAVEKHFIDVLLEEEAKWNMPQGQFKTGAWRAVMNENGMGPIANMVTRSDDAWAATIAANHKDKEFKKKGLQHYELLGRLFNSNTTTSFLQISSAQLAPNSDEERELDAAFLSSGIHVTLDADSVDDVEELPTVGEGQSQRQAEKRPAEPSNSSEKRKKGNSLEIMTEAIWGFIEIRNRRGKKSTDTGESGVGGDTKSITQAITLLNQHTDVDHVTYCKVVQELHNPKSRFVFFAMTVDRRRGWIEFIGGGLQ